MLREVLRFELRQQLKSPLFWAIALSFAALAFAAAGSDHIRIGGGIGNTHRNAPYVVVEMWTSFTVIGMFLVAVFVAGAALRDFDAGMAEMVFATPISRRAYFGGRFAAGYIASVVVLVVVALGIYLGVLVPWVDPARLGATSFAAYGYGFAVFVLWQVAMTLIGNGIDHRVLGALIDPFGLGAFEVTTRYWSPNERNTQLPEVAGLLMANRVIWLAVGAAMLAVTLAAFRLEREPLRLWRRRRVAADGGRRAAAPANMATARPAAPPITLRSNPAAHFQQFLKLARFETLGVLWGVPFLVMLAFSVMNLGAFLSQTNDVFGTPVYPVTHLLVDA